MLTSGDAGRDMRKAWHNGRDAVRDARNADEGGDGDDIDISVRLRQQAAEVTDAAELQTPDVVARADMACASLCRARLLPAQIRCT